MKISIVAPDLSSNGLGRACILAEMLADAYEVEIVGTVFGKGIWPTADLTRFRYRSVPGSLWPFYAPSFTRLKKIIDGDVVIASKPLLTSFGAALASVARSRRPLILDIDDDESAMAPLPRRPTAAAYHLAHPNGAWTTRAMHSRIVRADSITVASRGLQDEFGGTLIRHAKDTEWLRPQPNRKNQAKAALGLAGHQIVMFLGSPHPWKGVHTAAAAMSLMASEAKLVVIGALDSDPYTRDLRRFPHVHVYPPTPMTELPFLIQAADLVVIPQEAEPKSSRQLPSKLLDAMAAGKPVVATAVGDLPFILADGRGSIVPPGDPHALARALDELIDEPSRAAAMGRRAREWCELYASYRVVRAELERVVEDVRRGAPLRSADVMS